MSPSEAVPAVAVEVEPDDLGKLALALSKAQSQFTAVPKTKTAKVLMKTGGTYTYNYADLADIMDMCRKPLAESQIAFTQPFKVLYRLNGQVRETFVLVTTKVIHSSGQWMACEVELPVAQPGAQGIGSACTYAKRYGLCSLLGIVADEDDDGALADNGVEQQKPQAPPPANSGQHTQRVAQMVRANVSAAKPPPAAQPVAKQAPASGPILTVGKKKGQPMSALSEEELSKGLVWVQRLFRQAQSAKDKNDAKIEVEKFEAELQRRKDLEWSQTVKEAGEPPEGK